MKPFRCIVRSSIEAYRHAVYASWSFIGLLLWSLAIYVMALTAAFHLDYLNRLAPTLTSTDIFVLVEHDMAGVVAIGERLRNIPGVRGTEFVFPTREVPVPEIGENRSSGPFVFFDLRVSISEDTLATVLDAVRDVPGVFDALHSDLEAENLSVFHRFVRSGTVPVCIGMIGFCILSIVLLSWIEVDRYIRTVEVMRALGASRIYASMPCVISGGVRGVIGMLAAVPVVSTAFRFGLFYVEDPGMADVFHSPPEHVIITGMVAPALSSFIIAVLRAGRVFRVG